jgi:lipopolysaccharide/colanic/teichoic acid biosynthesis glycosyltransferase
MPGGDVFKRSVDIVLAGLLLIIALPFLALAAIGIKLDSAGPVIFRQVRVGRRFRSFQLLKLRTMRTSDGGPAYTFGADPRITRMGRSLRRYKFDELPQLWNVLRGEMSLVGPRPVIPELTHEFKQEYDHLLSVRPGLTDPATLKYFCESDVLALVPDPLQYFKTVVTPDKLRISQAYLERANLASDLSVMAGTALVLLSFLWRPCFNQPVEDGVPVPFLSAFVRRRKVQTMIEDAAITGPAELLAAAVGNSGRLGYGDSRFAYRHFRQERGPREWDRERFRL